MDEKTHWKIAMGITIPILLVLGIYSCNLISETNDINNSYTTNSYNSYNENKYDNDDYKDDMNDWYAGQSAGKDYDYNDGGSYYCLGKNDTCSRKTSNAYDLYCSSCDPDGDNVEG